MIWPLNENSDDDDEDEKDDEVELKNQTRYIVVSTIVSSMGDISILTYYCSV